MAQNNRSNIKKNNLSRNISKITDKPFLDWMNCSDPVFGLTNPSQTIPFDAISNQVVKNKPYIS